MPEPDEEYIERLRREQREKAGVRPVYDRADSSIGGRGRVRQPRPPIPWWAYVLAGVSLIAVVLLLAMLW